MSNHPDVIVIGAGAAGLTAAAALVSAGLVVTILEARDRVGGRMFTLRDSKSNAPVELGAEFIHGRPPEIWQLLRQHRIQTEEVHGDHWCVHDGQLRRCDFFSDVDKILKKMDGRKRDRSFLKFLEACCPSSNQDNPRMRHAKAWATGYVTGFNAVDPALVGVHWLVKGKRAEEKIEGDRAFRAQNGYADLLDILMRQFDDTVQKNSAVKSIHWRPGHVEVTVNGKNGTKAFSAPQVLITVPLGVLQAQVGEKGAILFKPNLPAWKQEAINNIVMGKVIRVTLRFRRRFWKKLPNLCENKSHTMDKMSFLFSHDDWFPTWWTMSPEHPPFLVGWAPFRCAERLSGQRKSFVVNQALRALHRSLGISVQELDSLFECAYCHDWQNDPFARGAYSYGIAGGDGADEALARPVRDTLFFAGEATDSSGHSGTVHGAIASGQRATDEIINAAARRTFAAGRALRKTKLTASR